MEPTATSNITDSEFIKVVTECGENITAIAQRIGVSRTAVRKRLRRIRGGMAKEAGKTAVIVQQNFSEGIADGARQLNTIQKLDELLSHIDTNLAKVTEFLQKSQKPNTVLIRSLTALVRESRGIVTDSFQIKKDLYSMRSVAVFQQTVMNIMAKYDPEIRKKIFLDMLQAQQAYALSVANEGEL